MTTRAIIVGLLATTAALACSAASAQTADTSKKKIVLSNNYAGNSWRQAMLKSWDKVTKEAVTKGVVSSAQAFTTAENQATEQAAQIQNLVLQGVDAIVVNAASPTALNGAIKQACDAGIVVVSFDGIVTEPCAYRVAVDFKKLGSMQIDYLKTRLADGGNLLEIRGIAGVFVDDEIHEGTVTAAKDSKFKIVGSVHGNWTQTVAQKEVAGILPTLPEIKAVVTQGGDGWGAAQAFAAAGRPTPIIFMGNREDELTWWKEQKDKNGYGTMSASIAPGSSTFAFWVAQQVLAGAKVPKDMTLPILVVTQDDLEQKLKETDKGGVTNKEYTLDEVKDFIAKAK
jgi:ribose transport system substrate-binding protein